MWEKFWAAWCRTMHAEPMWPMHGKYVCRKCLRAHEVAWQEAPATASLAPRPGRAASMDVCA